MPHARIWPLQQGVENTSYPHGPQFKASWRHFVLRDALRIACDLPSGAAFMRSDGAARRDQIWDRIAARDPRNSRSRQDSSLQSPAPLADALSIGPRGPLQGGWLCLAVRLSQRGEISSMLQETEIRVPRIELETFRVLG